MWLIRVTPNLAASVCMCMYLFTRVYVHAFMYVWACIRIFMYVYVYCVYVCTVRPAHEVTSIEQSPVLKGHVVLS